jgi:uncharacterized protein (TIGR03435 family)
MERSFLRSTVSKRLLPPADLTSYRTAVSSKHYRNIRYGTGVYFSMKWPAALEFRECFGRNFAILTVVIGIGTAAVPFVRGQSDAVVPKWEAVSIKPCAPGGAAAGPGPQGPGRMSWPCVPVEMLIHHSWLLFPDGKFNLAGAKTKVEKGPAWMYSDRYTIEAKAETVPGQAPPGKGTMEGPMLRALLADRFKLQMHHGTTPVPMYALTVAKDGPMLQATREGSCLDADNDHPPPPPQPGQAEVPLCGLPRYMNNGMDFYGVTITQFCATLSNFTDRKVLDKAGIEGKFDIRLNTSGSDSAWRPFQPPPPPQPGDPPPPDPGEVTARIQSGLKKLGLKLESTLGPEDVLIVDYVERPSEN